MYLPLQKYIKTRPSQVSSLAQCLYNFETLIACHDDGWHVKYVTSKAYKHNDWSLQSRNAPNQDAHNDGFLQLMNYLVNVRCAVPTKYERILHKT